MICDTDGHLEQPMCACNKNRPTCKGLNVERPSGIFQGVPQRRGVNSGQSQAVPTATHIRAVPDVIAEPANSVLIAVI